MSGWAEISLAHSGVRLVWLASCRSDEREAGSTLVLADDTVAAARHAAMHGWIASDALDEIGGEKRDDEGATGAKADAPGVDTKPTPTIVVDPDVSADDVR